MVYFFLCAFGLFFLGGGDSPLHALGYALDYRLVSYLFSVHLVVRGIKGNGMGH